MLDGTKRFHDKTQGQTVLRERKVSVLPSCVGTAENVNTCRCGNGAKRENGLVNLPSTRARRISRPTRLGVTEIPVVHGPTGADEAYLPVRASVTRGPAGSYATPITVVVVTAKKMVITRQSTRALTVPSRMSRETSGGNDAPVPQQTHSTGNGAQFSVSCRIVNTFLVAE